MFLLGSYNTIEDLEKTGGLALQQEWRYRVFREFKKKSDVPLSATAKAPNMQFDPRAGKFILNVTHWYYEVYDYRQLYNRSPMYNFALKTHLNPLSDPKFNLNIETIRMLQEAMFAQVTHTG